MKVKAATQTYIATDSRAYRRGERQPPTLRVVPTVGGFWRVIVHGQNNLADDGTYAEFDIGRGETKEAALTIADAWFAAMKDR